MKRRPDLLTAVLPSEADLRAGGIARRVGHTQLGRVHTPATPVSVLLVVQNTPAAGVQHRVCTHNLGELPAKVGKEENIHHELNLGKHTP